MNQDKKEKLVSIASPIALLLIWEAAARLGWIDTRFFPSPSAISESLIRMLVDGELWAHVSVSLQRIIIGFLLGAVPGVAIGLLMGTQPMVRAALEPLVHATFPIPKIAVLPLLMLIFGLGEGSKYAVIAVTVIYMALINAYEGVRDIPPIYMDVGHNYGANRWLMFKDVALPGAMPQIIAGLRISMGVSLLVIVAAEFVGARTGIGFLIWNSWQLFEVERMYVGLAVSAILGILSASMFNWIEKAAVPWRKPTGRRRAARLKRAS
ncbi:MAG: ABC transporter permease [Aquabacterium sp.]|jgi:NitT/TauT family transport system permease protein|uniref:ABC transporter permease n=1 Tax=Aquabacterium sp. TaxID=1872578 RepID=UPI002A36A8AC|nr:ABC transporter permease [Aquabacterium sp.]MDX9843949.1 ABC transporter permease [Aquabacterium sp.]